MATKKKAKAKPVKAKAKAKAAAPAAKKPIGMAVNIGLNFVDPAHYGGWDGELAACQFDAKDMRELAQARGMTSELMLDAQATRAKVIGAIQGAAAKLRAGDYFLLTYSGHGGQVDDVTADEDDRLDETWCLWDGELIDDELYYELGRFASGVRICVLSDSCHSGTVVRRMPSDGKMPPASRMMPPDIAEKVYKAHKSFYDGLQKAITRKAGKNGTLEPGAGSPQAAVSERLVAIANRFQAQLILISGCQDRQLSRDGARNGVFTGQLRTVWNSGAYGGNYAQLRAAVAAGIPPAYDQTPNLFTLGDTSKFVLEKPFTLKP